MSKSSGFNSFIALVTVLVSFQAAASVLSCEGSIYRASGELVQHGSVQLDFDQLDKKDRPKISFDLGAPYAVKINSYRTTPTPSGDHIAIEGHLEAQPNPEAFGMVIQKNSSSGSIQANLFFRGNNGPGQSSNLVCRWQ